MHVLQLVGITFFKYTPTFKLNRLYTFNIYRFLKILIIAQLHDNKKSHYRKPQGTLQFLPLPLCFTPFSSL